MSHEVTIRQNNTAEMAFVGETPWHGLGQQLIEGAAIETWMTAAGMDWRIQRSKVRYNFMNDGQMTQKTWDGQHVLFRSDTHAPLGLVSPTYKTVQPKQILEFFRDLTENAGYQLHTAGTLFGGRKFWALAKVSEATVVGEDKVGGYLLLSTSCDGSMATEARETTVRVVCNNTLSMARGSGKNNRILVSHRGAFDADKVKKQMGLTRDNFDAFMDQARVLSSKQVTNAVAENFVRELLRPAPKISTVEASSDFERLMSGTVSLSDIDAAPQRAPKGEAEILSLFRGNAMGGTLAGSRGTAWGLLNAVTEYVDHKSVAKSIDHRLDRAFFGSGDDLKNRAFEMANAL